MQVLSLHKILSPLPDAAAGEVTVPSPSAAPAPRAVATQILRQLSLCHIKPTKTLAFPSKSRDNLGAAKILCILLALQHFLLFVVAFHHCCPHHFNSSAALFSCPIERPCPYPIAVKPHRITELSKVYVLAASIQEATA